ncbi:MAG: gliding motility-associated C-terminal domain-containing protein [Vicingaceae bacterium]|nr:gliding motility-associated C-terminal domain-containing protein [Flavobacteriales bacterium]WKZ74274.1 MAG: gliding motility-associated C-terminal domain-containing protein [Vicingaceae bacterium]
MSGISIGVSSHWSTPSWDSSPDYFHSCNNGWVGIPQNAFGYEIPKTGLAYSGIALFVFSNNSKEYLQGKLNETLIKDSIYCISFWLSHADSANYYINVNNIGIWFKSDNIYVPTLYDTLPFIQSKVAFVQEDYYLENDSGWVELKINYKAKGGEKYFIIGNFALPPVVDVKYKLNSLNSDYAYYYLDEVSIYRCNDTLPPPVPKDTAYLNLPTAFSPNGDGQNDVFRVLGTKYVQSVELRVYNRWGQEVFYSNEKEQGWDGTFKGQPAPTGVYAYTLVATLTNGEVIHKKGNVTLKR